MGNKIIVEISKNKLEKNCKENIKDCDYCKCLDKKDYRQMLHCYIWFGGYLKIKEQKNGNKGTED